MIGLDHRCAVKLLGQTVVIVTHDPRAAAYADRAVFLKDGQIVEDVACDGSSELSQRIRIIMEAMEQLEL